MWQQLNAWKHADVVKRFNCFSYQISEWRRNDPTLTVEWLLVPDRVVWVSQKRLISWDFHTRVCRERCEKQEISSEQQFRGGRNTLLMRVQKRRARLVEAGSKATVMQITTHYNSGMQKSISEHTTRQTSMRIVYSSRRLKYLIVFTECIYIYITNYIYAIICNSMS